MSRSLLTLIILLASLVMVAPSQVSAEVVHKLGIHILQPEQLHDADTLVSADDESWHYVTVPITISDLKHEAKWSEFFLEAKKKKIIPIVRLTTTFKDGVWAVPTKYEIVQMIAFLERFEWPTPQRHIVVFNEVNHAKEWGGKIAPEEYADILAFTADWLHTQKDSYIVLPAAMDLAAANTAETLDAFQYWNAVVQHRADVIRKLDGWNSHAYPNPAFTAHVAQTGRNKLDGFLYELELIKPHTNKNLPVYITETGWRSTAATERHLNYFYQYAFENIWSDERVVAVTPFVLQGSPGPFAEFSFLDDTVKPTAQYYAFRSIVEEVSQTAQSQ